MTEARAIEEDMKLAIKEPYNTPNYLQVIPSAGNGAVITSGRSTIRLTVEERRRVAKALWPDAFKEDR